MADEVRITLTGGPYAQIAVPGARPSVVLGWGESAVVSAEAADALKARIGSKAFPGLEERHVTFESLGGEPRQLPAEVGEHKGAGWYYVTVGGTRQLDKEGEPVLVGRGKEKAQRQVDEMNAA